MTLTDHLSKSYRRTSRLLKKISARDVLSCILTGVIAIAIFNIAVWALDLGRADFGALLTLGIVMFACGTMLDEVSDWIAALPQSFRDTLRQTQREQRLRSRGFGRRP